ncbi:MAG: hypothetical protein Q9220_004803 [cf. Caloplaca sp. 1 TL-2023]
MDDKSVPAYSSDKPAVDDEKLPPYAGGGEHGEPVLPGGQRELSRSLKGRHMQMIAIGGSIGAGLFVGSGGALRTGGPASLVRFFRPGSDFEYCSYHVDALGELAVLYPVNGAFYMYAVRFIDPAWGFAMGWEYAIAWLVILPFEITAAGLTIDYWRSDINIGVWIAVFLTALALIQLFAVRGYGEVEFVLGVMKIIAVVGFIFLGVIIDCGGVPTDNRGYIGAHYWHEPGAFRNGFKGFCSVFVTAAFAFAGTELVGLAAAEAADPRKSLPKATKQVFWRITIFYVLSLFIVGLILPSDSEDLLGASGANTKASPFVLAIKLAGIKGLPSVFNVVITLSVLSVANSATFASTRTMQALALNGMGPRFLAYVDSKGRPVWCIVIQLLFGLLAFINEASTGSTVFTWLLSLSALSNLFVWASICWSHIRFRRGWAQAGHSVDELPYQAGFGVIGSYIGFILNILAIIATFYTSLFPVGASPDAEYFFESYLSAPIAIALYLGWKIYSRGRGGLWIRAKDMDVHSGMRDLDPDYTQKEHKSLASLPMRIVRSVF